MDEKLILHHMNALNCSREEAIQLIQDDKDVDKGISKPWDMTKEELRNAHKLMRTGTRKASENVSRTKKENPTKRAIIATIVDVLNAYGATVSNPERTIELTDADGICYTVTLTAHRTAK